LHTDDTTLPVPSPARLSPCRKRKLLSIVDLCYHFSACTSYQKRIFHLTPSNTTERKYRNTIYLYVFVGEISILSSPRWHHFFIYPYIPKPYDMKSLLFSARWLFRIFFFFLLLAESIRIDNDITHVYLYIYMCIMLPTLELVAWAGRSDVE
jgi:hypothetical protein